MYLSIAFLIDRSTVLHYVLTDLAKFKGLLIKKKVIKGFSAKLKVLKDCNQIKGF